MKLFIILFGLFMVAIAAVMVLTPGAYEAGVSPVNYKLEYFQ
jgi:hypothetical protein